MESSVPDRDKYESSGRLGLEFFVMAIPLAVVAALLMGATLYGLFRIGFYYFVVMPVLASIPVTFAVVLAVRWGKCRNRVIGGLLGLFAGLLTYGSYYHFDMVATNGPDHWLRIDAVPRHIWLRLQTDMVEAHPGMHRQNGVRSPWTNCFLFSVDGLLICAAACVGGVVRTGRVFCEQADRWADCRLVPLPPGTAQRLLHAMANDHLEDCLTVLCVLRPQMQDPYCELVVEFCSGSWGPENCCSYLSLRENQHAAKSLWATHYLNQQKFLVRQVALTADELQLFQKSRIWNTPLKVWEPRQTNRGMWLRRLRPIVLALGLIAFGLFLIDLPGIVLRNQVKIVNGQLNLPPLLLRLNNWGFVHWREMHSICLWSAIGILVSGAVWLKFAVSRAMAGFLNPPAPRNP